MVGREPRTADSVFGIRQEDGFDIPFFSGVTIEILQGGGLQILKPGEAKFVGLPPMQVMTPGPMDMHEMSMNGFMPVVGPRGFLKFLFVVPSPACLMGGAATDSRIRRGLVTRRQTDPCPRLLVSIPTNRDNLPKGRPRREARTSAAQFHGC